MFNFNISNEDRKKVEKDTISIVDRREEYQIKKERDEKENWEAIREELIDILEDEGVVSDAYDKFDKEKHPELFNRKTFLFQLFSHFYQNMHSDKSRFNEEENQNFFKMFTEEKINPVIIELLESPEFANTAIGGLFHDIKKYDREKDEEMAGYGFKQKN